MVVGRTGGGELPLRAKHSDEEDTAALITFRALQSGLILFSQYLFGLETEAHEGRKMAQLGNPPDLLPINCVLASRCLPMFSASTVAE